MKPMFTPHSDHRLNTILCKDSAFLSYKEESFSLISNDSFRKK